MPEQLCWEQLARGFGIRTVKSARVRTSFSVRGLGSIRDEKDPLDHVNVQPRVLFNAIALHTKYTEYIHRYGGSWLRPSRPRDKRCDVKIS